MTEPQDERKILHPDARQLRVLAHPLRSRLLGALRFHGPATATQLAARLGTNSGATSYHLRQLAAYGFVSEVADRDAVPGPGRGQGRGQGPGTGRERWWQAAHRGTTMDAADVRSAPVEAEAYLRAVASEYADRVDRWLGEVATLPRDWDQGSTLSNWRLRLRPDEAARLLADLRAVIESYRSDEPEVPAPHDAEPVALQLQLLPFVRAAR